MISMKKITKANGTQKQAKSETCYYVNYSICTCRASDYENDVCVGKEACKYFITEEEYFIRSMNGEKLEQDKEKSRNDAIAAKKYDLAPGKSKKALKKEAKKQAEESNAGSGFSLKDDPRFKDLFQ